VSVALTPPIYEIGILLVNCLLLKEKASCSFKLQELLTVQWRLRRDFSLSVDWSTLWTNQFPTFHRYYSLAGYACFHPPLPHLKEGDFPQEKFKLLQIKLFWLYHIKMKS